MNCLYSLRMPLLLEIFKKLKCYLLLNSYLATTRKREGSAGFFIMDDFSLRKNFNAVFLYFIMHG